VEIEKKIDCKDKTYNADAICAMQNHGKVRQTFIAIATLVQKKKFALRQTIIDIATLPLSLKKKKHYMRYGIPYYIVIWYTILRSWMLGVIPLPKK
jgi:hypothetical protein